MSIPIRQQLAVGLYVLKQKLRGVQRYPLVLMLEPLFRCNLACAGCGKIAYPEHVLNKRLSVAECVAAVEECDAPNPGSPTAPVTMSVMMSKSRAVNTMIQYPVSANAPVRRVGQ